MADAWGVSWGSPSAWASSWGGTVLAPVNATVPVITGSPIVGQTLQGSNGTWLNAPTSFTYQWYRDGVLIVGATTADYTPTVDDVDHALTIAVTASNSAGSATATSLPTSVVQASRRREEGGGAKRKRPPVRHPDRRQEADRQNEEALALILIMELE